MSLLLIRSLFEVLGSGFDVCRFRELSERHDRKAEGQSVKPVPLFNSAIYCNEQVKVRKANC